MSDPGAIRAAGAEYAGRRLEREGIPMVLALLDETGAGVSVADAGTLRDGAAYAALLDEYRSVLRPGAADTDLEALYDAAAVVAWVHRPGATPLPALSTRDTAAAPGGPVGYARHRAALAAGRFLRVVNYHSTPSGTEDQLERELRHHLTAYDPVTLDDLDAFLDTGRWPRARPGFVAAFYDGYRNHATVAGPVCDRLGLRAWFLPPTGFLAAPPGTQHAYAEAHDIGIVDEELAHDRVAMTPAELAGLARNHEVLTHTDSHAALPEVARDPAAELDGARAALAAATGRPPDGVVLRLGAPYGPGWPAPGHRWVVSNTAIQRLSAARTAPPPPRTAAGTARTPPAPAASTAAPSP